MNNIYLLNPKNPNLFHCVDAFFNVLSSDVHQSTKRKINRLSSLGWQTVLNISTAIVNTQKEDQINLFLFHTRPVYILLIIFLKFISIVLGKDFQVCNMMHEPSYEKGRASLATSYSIYLCNFALSHLSDKTIVPSEQAFKNAKVFIDQDRLYQINLIFNTPAESYLEQNLLRLRHSWEQSKIFSLIGIAAKDKNPEGFLSLAKETNRQYAGEAKFIRAGLDKDIILDYNLENIVLFPGYITNTAKVFLTSLTHIVVVPYSFSTQSGVIAESLSYGKVVIVNDIPSFSYLKGLDFVFVVDFNRHDEVVKCIHQIFSMTTDEYEKCYFGAINYFKDNHSELYLSKQLVDLL